MCIDSHEAQHYGKNREQDETQAVVHNCMNLGERKISLFYQHHFVDLGEVTGL